MVFFPAVTLSVPSTDVITWAFSQRPEKLDAPALVDAHSPERFLRRSDCLQLIRQAAAGLYESGIRNGDCVVLHASNDIYVPILALGCFAIGAIIAPTLVGASSEELARCITVSEASWIFVEPAHLQVIKDAASKASIPQSRIFLFDQPGSVLEKSFGAMLTFGERDPVAFNDINQARSVPVLRCFTSGSSGLPKAVEVPHISLTYSALQKAIYLHASKKYEMRWLYITPHYHMSIWPLVLEMLAGYGALYISKSGDISQVCDMCKVSNITDLTTSPKVLSELYNIISSGVRPASSIGSLKAIAGSGAPVQSIIVQKLKTIVGSHLHISSVYGSTEALAMTSLPYPEEPQMDPFPLGRAQPGVAFMLRDVESGDEINDFDTPGEIWVSSPAVYTHYYKNDLATRAAYYNDLKTDMRWFQTGDVGFISHATKEWVMIGRSGDVFKIYRDSKIHRVAPVRIETLLMGLFGVSDAAIGPVKDESGNTNVKLWIAPSNGSGSTLRADDVMEFLQGKVSPYDMPTAGIMFVAQIPRTVSGKIKRLELAKLQG